MPSPVAEILIILDVSGYILQWASIHTPYNIGSKSRQTLAFLLRTGVFHVSQLDVKCEQLLISELPDNSSLPLQEGATAPIIPTTWKLIVECVCRSILTVHT